MQKNQRQVKEIKAYGNFKQILQLSSQHKCIGHTISKSNHKNQLNILQNKNDKNQFQGFKFDNFWINIDSLSISSQDSCEQFYEQFQRYDYKIANKFSENNTQHGNNFNIHIQNFGIQQYLEVINKSTDKIVNHQYFQSSIICSDDSSQSQLQKSSKTLSNYTVISSSSSSSARSSKQSETQNQSQPCKFIQIKDSDQQKQANIKSILSINNKKPKSRRIRDQKYIRSRQRQQTKKSIIQQKKQYKKLDVKINNQVSKQPQKNKKIFKISYNSYKDIRPNKNLQFQNQVISLKDDIQLQQKKQTKIPKRSYPKQFFTNLVQKQISLKIDKKGNKQKKKHRQKQKQRSQPQKIGILQNQKVDSGIINHVNKQQIVKNLKQPSIKQKRENKIIINKQNSKQIEASSFQVQQKNFNEVVITYFKRSPKLLHILRNHHKNQSNLLYYLLKNSIYFQQTTLKIPCPPKIPQQFQTFEIYERIFLANLKSQLMFQIKEKVALIKEMEQNFQKNLLPNKKQIQSQQKQEKVTRYFNLTIINKQKLQKQQLFLLTALVTFENLDKDSKKLLRDLKHNYKSKHRLYIIYNSHQGLLILCQVKNIYENIDSNQILHQFNMKLVIGIDLALNLSQQDNPSQFVLYDITKMTTSARESDAISHLRYSPLCRQILNPRFYCPKNHNLQMIQKNSQSLQKLIEVMHNFYNQSQVSAISSISQSYTGIQLLQGPPGTGKTSTLIGILSCQFLKLQNINNSIKSVLSFNKQNKNKPKDFNKNNIKQLAENKYYLKILICTPSNSAVDLIMNKIIQEGLYASAQKQKCSYVKRMLNLNKGCQFWSGLRKHWEESKKNVIVVNQQQQNQTQIKQKYISTQQISSNLGNNLSYRKYPRILRIGVPENQQSHNNPPIINNSYKLQPIPAFNFNLQHIINAIFSKQMQNQRNSVSNMQLIDKVNKIKTQIIKIKQAITSIISLTTINLNQNQSSNNSQATQQYNKQHDSIINGLYNMIWVKDSIMKQLQNIIENPSKIHRNRNYNPRQYQLKDIIKQLQIVLIDSAEIILTTLTSSFSEKILIAQPTFMTLIVDQAAQATQPNLLIPLQHGIKKMVLIGDQCQLPPTIKNCQLINNLYNRSLFQRIWESRSYQQNSSSMIMLDQSEQNIKQSNNKIHMLDTQYRMNSLIRCFPSQYFYKNRLMDAKGILQRKQSKNLINDGLHLYDVNFIDAIKGRQQRHTNSYINKVEGQCVVQIVCAIVRKQIQRLRVDDNSSNKITIGVITPYSEQQKYIKSLLKIKKQQVLTNTSACLSKNPMANTDINSKVYEKLPQITVSTVDSYQGQERDIIIISTVRSNSKGNVGFLSDYRRINVSLTRAKYALLVIGNGKTLSMNQTWQSYIKWVKINGFHLMYDGAEAGNTINITSMLNKLFDKVKPAVQHMQSQNTHKLNQSSLWSISQSNIQRSSIRDDQPSSLIEKY